MAKKQDIRWIWRHSHYEHGTAVFAPVKVVVMALAGNWSLVRRPGCMPFAEMVKDLHLSEDACRLAFAVRKGK